MKKFLALAVSMALTVSAVFADRNSKISAGFGVGIGADFTGAEISKDGADADASLKAFDLLDIEGRLIFNSSNIAFLARVNGSIGGFSGEYMDNVFDIATVLSEYFGMGYNFQISDRLSLIPSAVIGVKNVSAEKTVSSIEREYEYSAIEAGVDVALLYNISGSVHFEVSLLATSTISGDAELSVGDFGADWDVSSGQISTLGKVGFVWLF